MFMIMNQRNIINISTGGSIQVVLEPTSNILLS